jgi:hypothetical protein
MADKSDAYENAVLNWLLVAAETPTRPTARQVALYTTMPNEANSGGVEVSTGTWTNYARQNVTFGAASGGAVANTNLVDFGTATTTGNVSVVGFAIVDQSGVPIYLKAFGSTQIVQNGNPVSFPIGDIDVTEA